MKYILTFDEISEDNFEKILEQGATKLYKNTNTQKRAFFVNEIT